jgi:hypothetical protein
MLAVNISDWDSRKLLRRDIFQAPQVDTVNLTSLRDAAYAKGAHAAVLAEIMLVAHGVEQILG